MWSLSILDCFAIHAFTQLQKFEFMQGKTCDSLPINYQFMQSS